MSGREIAPGDRGVPVQGIAIPAHVVGQLGLIPDSAADVADRLQELTAERERLDVAALQYRAEALDALRKAAGDHRDAVGWLDDAVAAARGAGATWQQVADAVGLTKASAHERWSRRG